MCSRSAKRNYCVYLVPGNTVEEIRHSLEQITFSQLQALMYAFDCDVGQLAEKIAKAKGLKNVKRAAKRRVRADVDGQPLFKR